MEADKKRLACDRFPDLSISDEFDPFARRFEWGNPAAQYICTAAIVACGAASLDDLNERLQDLQTAVDRVLDAAQEEGITPWLHGDWMSPLDYPGLAASLLGGPEESSSYPAYELHASMAVWLMLEARKALLAAEVCEVNRYVIQASICLAHCFGEGGRSVIANHEKALRTERAKRAGSSPRQATQERNARMRDEFQSGAWRTRMLAVEELARRYHLSVDHVNSLMKGVPFRRLTAK